MEYLVAKFEPQQRLDILSIEYHWLRNKHQLEHWEKRVHSLAVALGLLMAIAKGAFLTTHLKDTISDVCADVTQLQGSISI